MNSILKEVSEAIGCSEDEFFCLYLDFIKESYINYRDFYNFSEIKILDSDIVTEINTKVNWEERKKVLAFEYFIFLQKRRGYPFRMNDINTKKLEKRAKDFHVTKEDLKKFHEEVVNILYEQNITFLSDIFLTRKLL